MDDREAAGLELRAVRDAAIKAGLEELGDAFQAAIKPTKTSRRKAPLPPAPADAPLMTRAEVACLLRTTARQISNMTARGQLPAPVRVTGLGLRWPRAAVAAWIAEQMAA
ncbi:MAG TPA: hypothetical protein VGB85_01040 [Nannocystis sp.]|jgi:predicted DNA-binding transcriptional regulator AlpA